MAAADSGLVDRRRAERPDYHSQCHGSTVLGHTDALSRPFCGLGSLLRRFSVLDDAQTGNINDLIRKMFYCRRLNDREEALGNTPSRIGPSIQDFALVAGELSKIRRDVPNPGVDARNGHGYDADVGWGDLRRDPMFGQNKRSCRKL